MLVFFKELFHFEVVKYTGKMLSMIYSYYLITLLMSVGSVISPFSRLILVFYIFFLDLRLIYFGECFRHLKSILSAIRYSVLREYCLAQAGWFIYVVLFFYIFTHFTYSLTERGVSTYNCGFIYFWVLSVVALCILMLVTRDLYI